MQYILLASNTATAYTEFVSRFELQLNLTTQKHSEHVPLTGTYICT